MPFNLRRLWIHGLAVGIEATLGGLEDGENAETFVPVGAGRATVRTALDEVLAFVSQWFGFRDDHRFAHGFVGGGNLAVGPSEVLAVNEELLGPRLGVIEDRDARGTDHREFLLFEWIKPTDENMRSNAGGETHGREGGVGHT